jgi:hypothetical protein
VVEAEEPSDQEAEAEVNPADLVVEDQIHLEEDLQHNLVNQEILELLDMEMLGHLEHLQMDLVAVAELYLVLEQTYTLEQQIIQVEQV